MEQMENLKKGDVLMANLGRQEGSIQGGTRPVVVVQNDIGNKKSTTVMVVPLTTKRIHENYPFHVKLRKELSGLKKDSVALCEQTRVINKSKLIEYMTSLCDKEIVKINNALKIEFNL